jgi:hypothetical protein
MNDNGRIVALKKKEADIRAKLAAEQLKIKRRIDRENARLFALVGEALCRNAAQNPDGFGLMLRQVLGNTVSDIKELDFLRRKGML